MTDSHYHTFIDAIEEENRKKFVKTLVNQDIVNFKALYTEQLKISETAARHHLQYLLDAGIVIKVKQPRTKALFLSLSPKFLERARLFFKISPKKAYLGMVGKKNSGKQAVQAINRLRQNGWTFDSLNLFCTSDTASLLKRDPDWKKLIGDFQDHAVIILPPYEFEEVQSLIDKIIREKIGHYSLLADVTGSTKVHTLSLYNLAKEYGFPRIYLPEGEESQIITLP